MDASDRLEAEIGQTLEDLHDFAKWKLIVVAALISTALGLLDPKRGVAPWLLVFVPYACAYVDLNCYQYLLRIFLISKVLRGRKDESPLLCEYERECEVYRKKGFFSFGLFAQIGCSLVFAFVPLGFAFEQLRADKTSLPNTCPLLATWLVGVVLIVLCYWFFSRKSTLLESKHSEDPLIGLTVNK
jgi:hypothetical protein